MRRLLTHALLCHFKNRRYLLLHWPLITGNYSITFIYLMSSGVIVHEKSLVSLMNLFTCMLIFISSAFYGTNWPWKQHPGAVTEISWGLSADLDKLCIEAQISRLYNLSHLWADKKKDQEVDRWQNAWSSTEESTETGERLGCLVRLFPLWLPCYRNCELLRTTFLI